MALNLLTPNASAPPFKGWRAELGEPTCSLLSPNLWAALELLDEPTVCLSLTKWLQGHTKSARQREGGKAQWEARLFELAGRDTLWALGAHDPTPERLAAAEGILTDARLPRASLRKDWSIGKTNAPLATHVAIAQMMRVGIAFARDPQADAGPLYERMLARAKPWLKALQAHEATSSAPFLDEIHSKARLLMKSGGSRAEREMGARAAMDLLILCHHCGMGQLNGGKSRRDLTAHNVALSLASQVAESPGAINRRADEAGWELFFELAERGRAAGALPRVWRGALNAISACRGPEDAPALGAVMAQRAHGLGWIDQDELGRTLADPEEFLRAALAPSHGSQREAAGWVRWLCAQGLPPSWVSATGESLLSVINGSMLAQLDRHSNYSSPSSMMQSWEACHAHAMKAALDLGCPSGLIVPQKSPLEHAASPALREALAMAIEREELARELAPGAPSGPKPGL